MIHTLTGVGSDGDVLGETNVDQNIGRGRITVRRCEEMRAGEMDEENRPLFRGSSRESDFN